LRSRVEQLSGKVVHGFHPHPAQILNDVASFFGTATFFRRT
jgi:hypothetical protein